MAHQLPGPHDSASPPVVAVHGAWNVLAELLGTTATAALMRRAAKRALATLPGLPGLSDFAVEGAGYSYRYKAPPLWETPGTDAVAEVRALLAELCTLLSDLTGDVVTNRLAAAPGVLPYLPPHVQQRKSPHASPF